MTRRAGAGNHIIHVTLAHTVTRHRGSMDIHPVSNGYSTAYLVVDSNRAMLVDASTRDIAPKVLAKLAGIGAELKLIVLTHYHYDHVGAADTLRDRRSIIAIASAATAKVNVAHRGWLDPRSLKKLAARARSAS